MQSNNNIEQINITPNGKWINEENGHWEITGDPVVKEQIPHNVKHLTLTNAEYIKTGLLDFPHLTRVDAPQATHIFLDNHNLKEVNAPKLQYCSAWSGAEHGVISDNIENFPDLEYVRVYNEYGISRNVIQEKQGKDKYNSVISAMSNAKFADGKSPFGLDLFGLIGTCCDRATIAKFSQLSPQKTLARFEMANAQTIGRVRNDVAVEWSL